MLKIYEDGVPEHPLIVKKEAWHIEHSYDGNDILKFEIPSKHRACRHIEEEVRITDGKNRYVVKKIDDHGGYVNVECPLDMDDWRGRMWKTFRTTNSTLQQVFDKIKPKGWSLSGGEAFTMRATIEASDGKGLENVTAETVLSKASDVYGVVFNYDTIRKIVYAIDPKKYTPSGEFLTTELNLRSIGFVGNTTEIVTRLYPYGKKDSNGNPVTISSVNGGVEYIDNNQYTDRVISAAWSDERYTNPQNLLKAAKKKLDELSYPVRSYECDVKNIDETMYMYKVITLIDRARNKRVEHRVVKYEEYPEKHYLDVVTLSAVPPKIELSMRSMQTEMKERIAEQQKVSEDIMLDVLNAITGKNGGNIKIDMVDGNPDSIRVIHGEKDETVLSRAGVKRNGVPYLYAFVHGELEIGETGKGVVELPEEFFGKEISSIFSLQTVIGKSEKEVLQSINIAWVYHSETREIEVESNCKLLDISTAELSVPKQVIISYFIIGRDV